MSQEVRTSNFFILGAAKSGTTSLAHQLGRHPEVCFSEPKEPVFWELEYGRGLSYYRERYFQHCSGQRVAGEGRVFNLYLPYVPERIRKSLPEARLIAILRSPVERAYSHWWHRLTRGYERRPFTTAVGEELTELAAGRRFGARERESLWRENFFPNTAGTYTADLKHVPILEMGLYAEQLRRYYDAFPTAQIKILLFEELAARPAVVLEEICGFLGLDPALLPAGGEPRNVALDNIKGRLAFELERISWNLGLNQWVSKGVRTRVRRLLSRQQAERPPMPLEVRRRVADLFGPPNQQLEQLIGRDLAAWNSHVTAEPTGSSR